MSTPTDPHEAQPDAQPDGPGELLSGYALFEHAARREAPVPWHAQVPGDAIARMFPAYEGWNRLSRNENTALHTLIGDAAPAERPHTMSFYAYARPGQAVAVLFDPFLLEPVTEYRTTARLVYWPSLHPDKRRAMLSQTFNAAVVAPSPVALLASVREHVLTSPSRETGTLWRQRTHTLLRDLMDHPALDEAEQANLRTLAALGAFDIPTT